MGNTGNQDCIIVDDVTTSGSTLNALKNYIEDNGGNVVLATTLATTSSGQIGYGGYLETKKETKEEIENKFNISELNNLLNEYGISKEISDLTNSHAKYILTFKDVKSIRDRFAKAESEGSIQKNPRKNHSRQKQEITTQKVPQTDCDLLSKVSLTIFTTIQERE